MTRAIATTYLPTPKWLVTPRAADGSRLWTGIRCVMLRDQRAERGTRCGRAPRYLLLLALCSVLVGLVSATSGAFAPRATGRADALASPATFTTSSGVASFSAFRVYDPPTEVSRAHSAVALVSNAAEDAGITDVFRV